VSGGRERDPVTRRDQAIHAALERVRATCDHEARRAADPVGFVHRFTQPADQEIVALVAASLAFGNVTTIRAKLEDALRRVRRVIPSPAKAADQPAKLLAAMDGWIHRVFVGEDVARLMIGARRIQLQSGSLGARFATELEARGELRPALAAFCDALRAEGGLDRQGKRRGPAHILPDVRGQSAAKRLFLFLRWMIRPADGVDLGLWNAHVPTQALLCPVDTHIHKLSRNLGFTRRPDLSWRTAEEITAALARFDADDPVKYDFALCHLGMLQRCPSRKDPARCEGCGVKPVCRHWTSARRNDGRRQD
jgi:uncharacterized protein (TIGR02757 family)